MKIEGTPVALHGGGGPAAENSRSSRATSFMTVFAPGARDRDPADPGGAESDLEMVLDRLRARSLSVDVVTPISAPSPLNAVSWM